MIDGSGYDAGSTVRPPQTVYYHMGETFEHIPMTPTTSRSREYPCTLGASPADAAAGTERPWLRSGQLTDLTLCGASSVDWSDTEYGISDTQIRKASVDRAKSKQSDTLADMFGCSCARKTAAPQKLVQLKDRFAHSSRVASVPATNAAWCGEEETNDLSWCPMREIDDEIVEPRSKGWTVPGWSRNVEQRTKHPGERPPFALCPDESELTEEYDPDYDRQRLRAW